MTCSYPDHHLPPSYQSRVGAFNRFLLKNASSAEERELLAAKLGGRAQWRAVDACAST